MLFTPKNEAIVDGLVLEGDWIRSIYQSTCFGVFSALLSHWATLSGINFTIIHHVFDLYMVETGMNYLQLVLKGSI